MKRVIRALLDGESPPKQQSIKPGAVFTPEELASITACPHCHKPIDTKWITSANGKIITRSRKTFRGRDKVLYKCPYCGDEYHSQAMRTHITKCPSKPQVEGKKRGRKKTPTECRWCHRTGGYTEMQLHKSKCKVRLKMVKDATKASRE
jgi:hypothetical protein